jgi:hypothetical protein
VQGFDFENWPNTIPVEEVVELWLNKVESRFETFRTAYRGLAGVDLGARVPARAA